MRWECWEHFSCQQLQRKPLVSDPGMHHGIFGHTRTMMHVGIANPRWQRKRSQHSWRMRNPQFDVSGKRPMGRLQGIYCKNSGENWQYNTSTFLYLVEYLVTVVALFHALFSYIIYLKPPSGIRNTEAREVDHKYGGAVLSRIYISKTPNRRVLWDISLA